MRDLIRLLLTWKGTMTSLIESFDYLKGMVM